MANGKPLYPPSWWNTCCQKPEPRPFEWEEGDELIIRYVGCDSDGNPLFCVKRRPECKDYKPPCSCIKPRYFR